MRRLATPILALIFALAVAVRAQNDAGFNDLARVFQIDLPSADAAILMDASLSMQNHRYRDVRQAVINFTATLTNTETLHLRVFGDVAGAPLEDRADKIAGAVAEHLPAEPLFQYTDLGLAILKGLEFLERDGASDAQALFLVTDGMHQPPPGGPFTRDFANDPNWQSLRERAWRLCQKRQVMIYGFGLGRRTDIALLRQIFPTPNIELIVGDTAQVVTTLKRVRENLRQARLRRAVGQELNDGKIKVWLAQSDIHGDASGFEQPVIIQNNYRHLPVIIERVNLRLASSSNKEIICELEGAPSELTLAPGRQWQGRLKGELQADLPGLSVGRKESVYRAEIQIAPIARLEHEAELASLGFDQLKPLCDEPPLRIELRARYGAPYWLIALSVGACATFAAIILHRRKLAAKHHAAIEQRQAERRRVAGAIKIWPANKPEPESGLADLGIHKAERIHLAQRPDGLEIATAIDPKADFVATIYGHLAGATPGKTESGKVEFRLEAAPGHRVAYEVGVGWREAARVTLCDRDLIEIDGWRLRYANQRLRTRAEAESARRE